MESRIGRERERKPLFGWGRWGKQDTQSVLVFKWQCPIELNFEAT